MLTIYHSPLARSCRIIWLAEELGIEYRIESLALFSEAMTGPDYLAIHPLGKVPAIQDGELILWETIAIMEYMIAKYGDGKMLAPRDTAHGAKTVQWMEFGENQLTLLASEVIVHATDFLPPERVVPALVERGKKELPKIVGVVEQALQTQHSQEYIVAEDFSAADIMLGFGLMIATHAGFVNAETPLCTAYYERLAMRRAYQTAMSA